MAKSKAEVSTEAPSTALVVVQEKYLAALSDADGIREAMVENLGEGENFGVNDLDVIQNPSGGVTFWMVEDADGVEQPVRTLSGIILHVMPQRTRWDGSEEMGKPPLCSSTDGSYGIGDPGGACEICDCNQFTEDENGKSKGKACKENRILVMLFEGEFLPKVVKVTPASLKNFREYMRKKLTTKKIKKYEVETIMTLSKESGSKGDYAEMHFERGPRIDHPEVIKAYIDRLVPFLDNHFNKGRTLGAVQVSESLLVAADFEDDGMASDDEKRAA